MTSYRHWLLIAAVLLASHGASAWYCAQRYTRQIVPAPDRPLTLDLTPAQWAEASAGDDSACYLRVAMQVAAGHGVVLPGPQTDSRLFEPFFYWGPGCPWILGQWQNLVGGKTMWTFFSFAVVAQLIFGAFAVATAAIWTRSPPALAITAAASGICPPLQDFFYGYNLTSSEIVSLPLLAATLFALAKGFDAYRAAEGSFWRIGLNWRVWFWFVAAGGLIGLQSLVRDSGQVFATFVAVFLVGRSILADRRRLPLALIAAALLLGATIQVRKPVRRWNYDRIGLKVVSTSVGDSVCGSALWFKHDACPWYVSSGMGFGEYLDPQAPARIEEYQRSKKPWPQLYSLQQLVQAIWKRPADAAEFKLSRLPVLWLGSDRWPDVQLSLTAWWCLAFYSMLAAYCVVRRVRKEPIPEVLYLYILLLLAASPLMHFEFRYTFPVWNTLVIAPGLLYAELVRGPRSCTNTTAKSPTETASLTTDNRQLTAAL